jgi:competence protein ComEA
MAAVFPVYGVVDEAEQSDDEAYTEYLAALADEPDSVAARGIGEVPPTPLSGPPLGRQPVTSVRDGGLRARSADVAVRGPQATVSNGGLSEVGGAGPARYDPRDLPNPELATPFFATVDPQGAPAMTDVAATTVLPDLVDVGVPASDASESAPSAGGTRSAGLGAFDLSAFDPGRRGVRALGVVAAVVVLIAGFLAWQARPVAEPVPAPAIPSITASSADGAPPTSELVVAVAGKVKQPGLVRLPPGARISDALQAAGGAQEGVDVGMLNLARKVVDGELIVVGATSPPDTADPAGASGAQGIPGAPGGRVNLNTATLSQLDGLPGVGPVLAQRILDHRTQTGAFRAVSDLRKVDGIGDSRYEQLKDLVTV